MRTHFRFFFAALTAVFIVFLAAESAVLAQTTYTVATGSSFTITGRSNQSDWDVSTTTIEGELELADGVDPIAVVALSMSVPAAEISAPRGLIMDRIMQGSLKSDEYPNITFELTSAEVPDVPNDSLNLVVHGTFTLTGTSKDVSIEVLASIGEGGSPRYSGSFPLTMTDYGMETPTAMFGRLRVHKDIEVAFDLVFGQ